MTDNKVLLTRLHQYRTRDGREYLRGYLGETKILIFRDDRAECPPGAEAIWNVFLEPAPRKNGSQASTSRNASDAPAKKAPAATPAAPKKKRKASGRKPGYYKFEKTAPKPEVAANTPFIDDEIPW